VDEVIRLFDRAGIRRVLVSSTPDEGTWRLFDAAPDRVVPMLRLYHETGDSSRWQRDTSLIGYVVDRMWPRTAAWTVMETAEFNRRWLGQLPSEAAEQIAWRNAERLFPAGVR
jgi:hypothetical protein